MATLINLGFSGINAEYIVCWEDDPQEGELHMILGVPYLDVKYGGTHHLQRTFRGKERTLLLQYLETQHI